MEPNRAKALLKSGVLGGERDVARDERIKILFLMIQMGMGGTERLIYDLVRNLDRNLFAPSIGWFMQERPLKEFEDLQVPLYYVPKVKRFDALAMHHLSRIVREQAIDIINAHHFMSFFYAFYAAKMAGRAALIYTEHSTSDVLSVTDKWRAAGVCLLPFCDAVVGVNARVADTLGSHFRLSPDKVHTVQNGVDMNLFGNSSEERMPLRSRLGFCPQDILIAHVANFRRNKNHLFLLRAFREVARQHRHAKLVFIGTGAPGDAENSEPAIRNFILDNGLSDKVSLMGYRSDVKDLLTMMDIFCLVSYNEGLPLSVIEAMASRLPVIGTDIEGIRDVIEPQVNGLLVVPDDVPGLAHALNGLIEEHELRQRMAVESRRIATEKYGLDRCIEQTQRLLLSVVARHPMHVESTRLTV